MVVKGVRGKRKRKRGETQRPSTNKDRVEALPYSILETQTEKRIVARNHRFCPRSRYYKSRRFKKNIFCLQRRAIFGLRNRGYDNATISSLLRIPQNKVESTLDLHYHPSSKISKQIVTSETEVARMYSKTDVVSRLRQASDTMRKFDRLLNLAKQSPSASRDYANQVKIASNEALQHGLSAISELRGWLNGLKENPQGINGEMIQIDIPYSDDTCSSESNSDSDNDSVNGSRKSIRVINASGVVTRNRFVIPKPGSKKAQIARELDKMKFITRRDSPMEKLAFFDSL